MLSRIPIWLGMLTAPPSLADRFAAIIAWLLKAACTENNRRRAMDGPLTTAFIFRVQRLRNRFVALYAKWKAGRLPARRRRRRAGPARPTDKPRPPSLLPRSFAWLHRFVPESAPPAAGKMFPLFEDPELLAFHDAAPQVGRILRPYCWMVGVKPPHWLALPKRKRVRKVAATPPARAVRPLSREAGDWAAERTNRGGGVSSRPIDVTKLSSVAYGNLVHPECDAHPVGLCPPNKIGYARPRWPPKNRGGGTGGLVCKCRYDIDTKSSAASAVHGPRSQYREQYHHRAFSRTKSFPL